MFILIDGAYWCVPSEQFSLFHAFSLIFDIIMMHTILTTVCCFLAILDTSLGAQGGHNVSNHLIIKRIKKKIKKEK